MLLVLLLPDSGRDALASAAGSERGGRFYEPVEVPGSFFPGFLGKENDTLALYAWTESGTWRPVLFQIDERTPDGDYVFTKGPQANTAMANGVFDSQDLVAFLAREALFRAPENLLPPGAATAIPVELLDPVEEGSRWVYLTCFNRKPPAGGAEPVSILSEAEGVFRFRFPTYRYDALTNNPNDKPSPTIYIDKLWILKEAGGSGENILDRQKTRGVMSFMGGLVKIRFNEGIVQGGVVAYQPGPVRLLTHSSMYPRFPLGVRGPGFTIDSVLVDTLTLTRITMNVPLNPGYVMHEMSLAFGTDLAPAAKGMRFYNSANPQGLVINGSMSAEEKSFNTAKDEWRLITGPQGTQITCTSFDPRFLTKGKVVTTYLDDETARHPPENFPGDLGAVFDELTIRGLPAGAYTIEVFGCIPYGFHDPRGLNLDLLEEILNIQKQPLVLRVGGRELHNQGGCPRVLREPRRQGS